MAPQTQTGYPTEMDASYDRKRFAHLDDRTLDNSYSHLSVPRRPHLFFGRPEA